MKPPKRGWIKVSPEAWETHRLKRLVKRIIKIEHINFDPVSGFYVIVGISKYFTVDHKEGDILQQYFIIVKSEIKKWLIFKYKRLTFEISLV